MQKTDVQITRQFGIFRLYAPYSRRRAKLTPEPLARWLGPFMVNLVLGQKPLELNLLILYPVRVSHVSILPFRKGSSTLYCLSSTDCLVTHSKQTTDTSATINVPI